jgi:hypothetical protein
MIIHFFDFFYMFFKMLQPFIHVKLVLVSPVSMYKRLYVF